ncbi:lactonase family protein (plasmid) [Cupriavidus pauculus]|uniref:Lactonase family protein n=1 Tax=Cupriavidus pauculus TaxID=82633 RepID=A0A5P2H735_9BURK|nr:beta-propeller fold lactonase family protein [Cupriavidus pauculus]QET03921.1 lactonase family protein [Cupriavidus pauculus]
MFPRLPAGARAFGIALLATAVLAACGSDDNATPAQSATPGATKVVVDTSSAAPVAGTTLTLKATVFAADGNEVKGASFAWTSSDESVAVVTGASDKSPAGISASVLVGTYATVQTRNAGVADITATATLADGGRATAVTHLVVQSAPAKSYTLTLSPATLTVTAGAAAQTVTAAVRRSDGVDGIADLINWSWSTGDITFPVTAAVDGRSAQISSPSSATLGGSAVLAACADTPTGARLCGNAALARPTTVPLPTYTVGGTVSGLAAGKSLMLAGANGDTAVVSAGGAFSFPTGLVAGTLYGVTVSGQPAGQTCTVQNGSGTIAGTNVTDVTINCVQAQFVVVPNSVDFKISVYRIDPRNGTLAAVPGSPFATTRKVTDIAFLPSGLVGYAIMRDDDAVEAYQLDPATGALSVISGTSAPTSPMPEVISVHPTGKWLIIGAGRTVLAFSINPLTNTATATGQGYWSGDLSGRTSGVAVSPNGRFIYSVNTTTDEVWSMAFDPLLGTVYLPDTTPPTGSGARSAVVSADGRMLYSLNMSSNTIGVGAIDPVRGAVTAIDVFPTMLSPTDIVLAPSGPFAYVLTGGQTANGIQVVRRNLTTGLFDQNLGSTPTGFNAQRLHVDPSGRFLYSPSFLGELYGFAINSTTGALTPVPGSPFPTGNGNIGMAIVEPLP